MNKIIIKKIGTNETVFEEDIFKMNIGKNMLSVSINGGYNANTKKLKVGGLYLLTIDGGQTIAPISEGEQEKVVAENILVDQPCTFLTYNFTSGPSLKLDNPMVVYDNSLVFDLLD